MDYNFQQSKLNPKVVNGKISNNKTTIATSNSMITKPRQISTPNQNVNSTSPSSKITKRIGSSSLVQPTTQTNFSQSRLTNTNSRINSTTSTLSTNQKPLIKKPTITTANTLSTAARPLTVNSSVSNRLNYQQSSSKLQSSRTSSTTSIKGGREPKKLVKDTISNSSFVPKEKLEKLTKKYEELTNKFNLCSKQFNRNQLAVDALSCLINYMSIDLNAFDNPKLKQQVQHLQSTEQELKCTISNLTNENEKVNSELEFERHRSQKEKENLLEMFQVEMKSSEKTYQENIKIEQIKRDKAEKDLLYLKQNLSKDKKIDFLTKEIESLKTVLEIKDNEIRDLRYKLDRTFVDKDEISQLRCERDNLSLANEQLEYSLNLKNEELKFVLQENTSLASLNSLTSTPLNSDRNNNNLVKKRKMTNIKKQKLDTDNNNDKDNDNFIKPLNLHKERFVKSAPANRECLDRLFENNNEIKSEEDNHHFIKPLTNESSFVKQLIEDTNFDEEVNFNASNSVKRGMSFDYDDQDEFNFKRPLDIRENAEFTKPNSIENNNLNDSFNRQMDISPDKSLDKSYENKPFDNKPLDKSFDNKSSNSFSSKSPFDKPLDIREKNSSFNQENLTPKTDKKDNNSFVFDKPFDINDIKERCFAKPVVKSTPVEENVNFIAKTSQEQQKIESNQPEAVFVQPENFIKTVQILNDDELISNSIIKSTKNSNNILDSGFCDL